MATMLKAPVVRSKLAESWPVNPSELKSSAKSLLMLPPSVRVRA